LQTTHFASSSLFGLYLINDFGIVIKVLENLLSLPISCFDGTWKMVSTSTSCEVAGIGFCLYFIPFPVNFIPFPK
jgi:hypothetical protein